MKKILFYVGSVAILGSVYAQSFKTNWTYKTDAKVLASPIAAGHQLFVGDQSGVFYSLDRASGKLLWKYETEGNIQAKATRVDNQVFFESANRFYLINASDGELIWTFDPEIKPFIFKYEEHEWPYKIDPFDDKRSSATVEKGIIYIGCGNGIVYGLDVASGIVVRQYPTDEASPVRSTPYISDDKLFFGDWNGLVYCYDLVTNQLVWKKRTYRGEKPYGTFGGVVSEFTEYEGLLFFGARNFMLNVLEKETGEKYWTYTDPKRGWMIGDPVIYNDTLYVGGSDNFSLYAFHPTIGQLFWQQNGGKNIYTKPAVSNQFVVYTSGNGYNPNDPGKVFLLQRKGGKVLDTFDLPKGSFSSPLQIEHDIFFGAYDGLIYSLSIE